MNRLSSCMVLTILLAISAEGSDIYLFGDTTPIYYLTDSMNNHAVTGNQRLFENLSSGRTVAIFTSSHTDNGLAELEWFLVGTASVVTLIDSITAESLLDIDLLLIVLPDRSFSDLEATAIAIHLDEGGYLMLTGEGVLRRRESNDFINALLLILGSSLHLTDEYYSGGAELIFVDNPITAGIDSLTFGASVTVDGGDPLIIGKSGDSIFSIESL